MELGNIAFDRRFGHPVVKDGCGVFGMLRKVDAALISSKVAVNGISCIKYRGGGLCRVQDHYGAQWNPLPHPGVRDRGGCRSSDNVCP